MISVASALDRLWRPGVVVVGAAPEIDTVVSPGTPVLRVDPEALEGDASPVALAILDGRSYAADVLARARHTRRLSAVPAVLVGDAEMLALDEAIGVDDAFATPLDRHAVRRLRTLYDLGRTRVSLAPRGVDAGLPVSERASVRQAAQRKLFDQKILDSVDVGIVTTDTEGLVTFVNRCAREVLGADEGYEGDVRALLQLETGPMALSLRRSDRRWNHCFVSGDREIEIELSVSHVEDTSHGRGFYFVFHDRTQDRQVEMERRRFERLAAMGTMVAGFAHEIRNPMASLRSLAESLNEELAEASLRLPHVDRMLGVLDRVERLVRTSLLFGRPSPPRQAAHAPWTLLSAAISAVGPRTREVGGDLNVETETGLPDVYVDDGQIVQALVILLNNALDAAGAPRRVTLRAQCDRPAEPRGRKSDPPPRRVRLSVRDEGRGIPPDILGRIFDPFFTTKSAGVGLGLSIAQQLVTENGGRIEVVSALGGPTVFSLLVPVAGMEAAPVTQRGGGGSP